MPICDHTNWCVDRTKAQLRISLASILLITTHVVSAQQKISGRITGIGDSPLVGASVQLKSSNHGTIADENGFFEMVAKQGDLLVISNVGYLSREIKLAGDSLLQISLRPSLVNLDEVVVTGYTAQKVKEITGSVAVVRPKDLVAAPGGQVEQMLQGRVAGLNVISSGQPGGGSNVRLHGIGNFGDVTPLYIIDGVEGNINNLNPYDIESLQVLKDASAYAIYGVRGANGVIVVTTKKGNSGKPTVTYNFYLGYQLPLKEGFQYLSPIEEADLVWLRNINSKNFTNGYPSDPLYGNGPFPILPDYIIPDSGYRANDPQVDPDRYNVDYTKGPIHQISKANKEGTDWFHELFKPAFNQNHTITVSGGNEGSHYLFSLGYTNQQGTC
jgi:TonB-dependent SusC/RagA subfamily outer membrane receptor